jgi:small subunit ribosomal protein S18
MNNRNEQKAAARKERQCYFCLNNVQEIDYKDTNLIKRFLSSFAKIVSRKRSKVCVWHQRKLETAIKRARVMALVPFIQR